MIWYPKCSTCKKAKAFLEEKNILHNIRDIVLETPSIDELKRYISLSKKDIRNFFNTSGLKYRELDLKNKLPSMTEHEMLSLLSNDGMLIKRPILVSDKQVLIGFREKEWSEINENN